MLVCKEFHEESEFVYSLKAFFVWGSQIQNFIFLKSSAQSYQVYKISLLIDLAGTHFGNSQPSGTTLSEKLFRRKKILISKPNFDSQNLSKTFPDSL